MKARTCGMQLKSTAVDGDVGTFEAVVAVFGNIDHAGDRILRGAFRNSLTKWQESGDPIPVVFSHRWDDLDAHIGKVLNAEERTYGLWVRAALDLDDPTAAKVYRLLKDRRIREFSFAYDVLDERRTRDGVTELLELDIIEVGPTLVGMNPETQLLAVKAGRAISGSNLAKLEEAATLLREALAEVEATIEATTDREVASIRSRIGKMLEQSGRATGGARDETRFVELAILELELDRLEGRS